MGPGDSDHTKTTMHKRSDHESAVGRVWEKGGTETIDKPANDTKTKRPYKHDHLPNEVWGAVVRPH